MAAATAPKKDIIPPTTLTAAETRTRLIGYWQSNRGLKHIFLISGKLKYPAWFFVLIDMRIIFKNRTMAKYVDGFVLPIPKKNIASYLKMAQMGAKVWKKYGALEYIEAGGGDL